MFDKQKHKIIVAFLLISVLLCIATFAYQKFLSFKNKELDKVFFSSGTEDEAPPQDDITNRCEAFGIELAVNDATRYTCSFTFYQSGVLEYAPVYWQNDYICLYWWDAEYGRWERLGEKQLYGNGNYAYIEEPLFPVKQFCTSYGEISWTQRQPDGYYRLEIDLLEHTAFIGRDGKQHDAYRHFDGGKLTVQYLLTASQK